MPVSKPRKKRAQQRRPSKVSASRKPKPTSARQLTLRRAFGWALVGGGLALVLVNWSAIIGVGIMPGGHSPLYFVAGLGAAVAGAALLGIFEP